MLKIQASTIWLFDLLEIDLPPVQTQGQGRNRVKKKASFPQ